MLVTRTLTPSYKRDKLIFLRAKDISRILGLSYSGSYRRYKLIQDYFNKQSHQFISMEEFCEYEGLEAETVKNAYF